MTLEFLRFISEAIFLYLRFNFEAIKYIIRFMYLWQAPNWPNFQYDLTALQPTLARARVAQGRVLGLAGTLQLVDLAQLELEGWAAEAVATAEIEGEVLHRMCFAMPVPRPRLMCCKLRSNVGNIP